MHLRGKPGKAWILKQIPKDQVGEIHSKYGAKSVGRPDQKLKGERKKEAYNYPLDILVTVTSVLRLAAAQGREGPLPTTSRNLEMQRYLADSKENPPCFIMLMKPDSTWQNLNGSWENSLGNPHEHTELWNFYP